MRLCLTRLYLFDEILVLLRTAPTSITKDKGHVIDQWSLISLGRSILFSYYGALKAWRIKINSKQYQQYT